ncbi:hypothetical protein R3P38DRAFT_618644 [Favolaschia claudopus]|uniref:Uncharacterized protein n=1 Tax=Favolaschia claudopus TaxID=2862362 RepID=A0AAW0CA92_9AGAR
MYLFALFCFFTIFVATFAAPISTQTHSKAKPEIPASRETAAPTAKPVASAAAASSHAGVQTQSADIFAAVDLPGTHIGIEEEERAKPKGPGGCIVS